MLLARVIVVVEVLPNSQDPRLCTMLGDTVTSTSTALPVTPTSTRGVNLSVIQCEMSRKISREFQAAAYVTENLVIVEC